MSYYLKHPEFFNQPLLLSEELQKDPGAILYRFFTDYNLSELREYLDEMQQTCLTTDNSPFDVPTKRGDLLLLIKNITRLLEAAYLIQSDWEKKELIH